MSHFFSMYRTTENVPRLALQKMLGKVLCQSLSSFTGHTLASLAHSHFFMKKICVRKTKFYSTNDIHSLRTEPGFDQPYTKTATLLASLYVCFLLIGLVEEVASLLESAPSKYIADAGTVEIRELTRQTPQLFSYFWFIFNEAPLYDKFSYCIKYISNEELVTLKHYSNIPSERIPFEKHIYGHLQSALGSWSNAKCGEYKSPLLGI